MVFGQLQTYFPLLKACIVHSWPSQYRESNILVAQTDHPTAKVFIVPFSGFFVAAKTTQHLTMVVCGCVCLYVCLSVFWSVDLFLWILKIIKGAIERVIRRTKSYTVKYIINASIPLMMVDQPTPPLFLHILSKWKCWIMVWKRPLISWL